ncbi:type II secretion system protein F [Photobacterium sanctipauli]|uniref:Type II secretion system protein F n=1 Tax=Photobacterium sanctipauli TaxID=1342794 RepID=A0A2T3NQ04_9GAMM|nr:type II secretion system F family protein [Photobacterium sanctipauli]PSW18340.1 type II secretion system protein F [Photobacterium sanctipauli]
MIYLSLILFGIAALLYGKRRNDLRQHYLYEQMAKVEFDPDSKQVVNIRSLTGNPYYRRITDTLHPAVNMLGNRAWLKILVFVAALASVSGYINKGILLVDNYWLPIIMPLIGLLWGWGWLLKRRRDQFEETFPDALNIMMSAITAGESVMRSISYVGEALENDIGKEFKVMGERLKLGEPPELVFRRACNNYPYPAFLFFVVTIRANMSRGGQMKGVMARLIRVLVNARTLEKKKIAMTSEARLSAKIVAALPIAFMVLLSYLNPTNLDFVLYDPTGRYVLYYVVGSEVLGLLIIWLLIKGVR